MSAYQIRKKLKDLGVESRKMRWSRELRTLSQLISDTSSPKDFFFEFWCYLTAVKAFDEKVASVKLEIPIGQTHCVWPLKPGSPDKFSYFSFSIASTSYGIYPGVKFKYKEQNSTFAPDISIRSVTTTKVKPKIYAAWDAKYRDNPKKRITRDEVYTFNTARSLLPIARSKNLNAKMASAMIPSCFRSCGLISNGNFSTEQDSTLSTLGLMETARFGTKLQITRP